MVLEMCKYYVRGEYLDGEAHRAAQGRVADAGPEAVGGAVLCQLSVRRRPEQAALRAWRACPLDSFRKVLVPPAGQGSIYFLVQAAHEISNGSAATRAICRYQ